ncbi:MAG TPA: TIGR01777 family oxidoreductase [Actinomycetales bacterium]
MKVAVTGSSGLIGSALVPFLRQRGDEVITRVRREPPRPGEVRWDPAAGQLDPADLVGVEGVVHLAGAGVGDHRWTDSYKRQILDSRVDSTRTLSRALAQLDPLPRVLVSGSAMGFYGERGDEVLSEASPGGHGFLPDVVVAWEGAADPARAAGIRVAHPRTSLVMAPKGGAFGQLLPLVRLGLGGPLGSGRQWWSWITLPDEVRALAFLLDTDISGPVNLATAQPLPQKELTAALGKVARRPSVLPVPRFALRAALGQFSDDVLTSARLSPEVLTRAGFRFEHPDIDTAARWVLDA